MFIHLSVVSKSKAEKLSNQYMPLVMELEVPDAQIRSHLEKRAPYPNNSKLDHVSKLQEQSFSGLQSPR